MAQTLTENKSSSGSPSQEFSDLAWKFNNLNSTAKMLLVGTSSQSVPFIPISELAYETTSSPRENAPTSLSSLAKPIQVQAPSVVVARTSKTFPDPVPVQSPINFPIAESEPVNFTEEKVSQEATSSAAIKDDYAPFKPVFYSRTETVESPVEELPLTDLPPRKQAETTIIQPVEEPLYPRENRHLGENYQQPSSQEYENVTPWGYSNHYEDTAERALLHNENIYEQKKGSFWGPFLKTTGVVSAVVLLGMGAMYLLNSNKNPDLETSELDSLSSDIKDPATVENSITSPSSTSKTFFEEKTNNSTSDKSLETSSAAPDDYYQPKVLSKPPVKNKIKTTRPTVYTAPNSYQKRVSTGYPVYSTTTPSNPTYTAPDFSTYQKPAPLYDPATIYDSTAENAIKPSTYSAEDFPLEISYAKESLQYEAAFTPTTSTSSASVSNTALEVENPTTINSTSPSEEQPLTDTNKLTKEETSLSSSQEEKEDNSVERVNSNYPIENQLKAPSSAVKLAPVPLYSKPLSETESIEETTSKNDDNLESPILREPVQSSSNDVFASPYATSATPLTTSVVVQQKPPITTSRKFFGRRKYTNEYRREAAVNNANTAMNTYQTRLRDIQRKAESNSLSESERLSLLKEVEILKKNIENTQIELNQNRNPLTRKASNSVLNDEKQLNNLEKEANRVYLKPNFESEDSDLNISYLD